MLTGEENAVWIKVFAALIIIVMTGVNVVGSQLVANAQTVIVYVVLGILTLFAVVTLVNINPSLLAPSKYPPLRDIISAVALTFFAFLGFGIITFTAKDLAKPSRQLPRAMYLALVDRDRHLRRHRAGRVRHALGGEGDLLRGHRAGRGRRAHARPGGLLADERHRPVRHRRGHQRRAVPGARAVRAAGGNAGSSRR